MNGLEAWRQWLTWLRAGHSPDTVRAYAGNALRFLAETDCKDFADYTEQDCARFFDDPARRGRVRYEYAKTLRSFFGWGVRQMLIAVDPMAFIRMKKPRRVPPIVLTQDELAKLLKTAEKKLGERVAWSILLIYLLGLRRIEAAGLKWEHVREGDTGPVIEIHQTKGATERDPLPLSPLALRCLARLKELPAPPQALVGEEYILRVRRATVSDWVHTAGVAAGLHPRKIGAHRLRATVATRILKSGADIRAVQKALGHARLESTEWYLAESDEAEVRAALALAG
jgi:integrase/recombinase XerC